MKASAPDARESLRTSQLCQLCKLCSDVVVVVWPTPLGHAEREGRLEYMYRHDAVFFTWYRHVLDAVRADVFSSVGLVR